MMTAERRHLTFAERILIYRCLRGVRLPCGCVAGRYLTYGGDQITVVDHVARGCQNPAHRVDAVIEEVRATK